MEGLADVFGDFTVELGLAVLVADDLLDDGVDGLLGGELLAEEGFGYAEVVLGLADPGGDAGGLGVG